MRTAKHHPQVGWLFLEPRDYARTLDRLLLERDRLDDLTHSGPAPAYLAWVWAEELPELARRPFYARQFEAHITELELKLANLQREIDAGRLDLRPAAGQLSREIRELHDLLAAGVMA
jgi:hypothetical protein